jgi:hypothetical protein
MRQLEPLCGFLESSDEGHRFLNESFCLYVFSYNALCVGPNEPAIVRRGPTPFARKALFGPECLSNRILRAYRALRRVAEHPSHHQGGLHLPDDVEFSPDLQAVLERLAWHRLRSTSQQGWQDTTDSFQKGQKMKTLIQTLFILSLLGATGCAASDTSASIEPTLEESELVSAPLRTAMKQAFSGINGPNARYVSDTVSVPSAAKQKLAQLVRSATANEGGDVRYEVSESYGVYEVDPIFRTS